jgi:hypothetical protein
MEKNDTLRRKGWVSRKIIHPKEISNVIDCCFNMDGAKPTGCNFGLIDEYHI